MQLPHGTLVNSQRGPVSLKELGASVAREELTGYVRVSVFDKNSVCENVAVFVSGKPVMSFASDSSSDRKDPDQKLMEAAVRKDNAIIEICRLADKQVKLLQDLYRDFAFAPAAPAPAVPVMAPAKPAPGEVPRDVPAAAPAMAPGRREEKQRYVPMPEIRGRFVRAENVTDLEDYMRNHPGETGHLLFLVQRDRKVEEHHIIIIKGKIEATYNGHASGPGLLESLKGASGPAEFYSVDEALLTSIIGRQTKAASAAAPVARPEKPVPGIGISAKDLLDSTRLPTARAYDDIGRTAEEISGGIEDDLAMVKRVEREFAGHVDELLCKLELSHLRARKKR